MTAAIKDRADNLGQNHAALGLDWAGLMRVGMSPRAMGGLGLVPDAFWRLSPGELALMLGISPGAGVMTRDRLAELSARFPDADRAKAVSA
ncbi:phage tail assembly chaperone [Paracoccus sp. (in: a-proteobacteria)]|uniref:phage tail assembly chaperone n=1 Tax=Paracoccus sp. TaxID=267 RepID=UPI00289991CA|nr:phage tail assembly chaperone [Paracoccus sp. (in: a-proteobacteria)]